MRFWRGSLNRSCDSPRQDAPLSNRYAMDPLSGDGLFADVEHYCALGDHRTATECDFKTSQWIADELSRVGFTTRFHPFTVRQFFLKSAQLKIAGRDLECFPLWPPRATPGPVIAKLARLDSASPEVKGRIALVRLPKHRGDTVGPRSPATQIVDSAVKTGAIGVLAATEGPTGEIIAMNSFGNLPSWQVPVFLVAPRDLPKLEAVQPGDDVSMLIDGDANDAAPARNVIATLPASDPASSRRELMIVSTPISGWFRCGAERGPGIAMLLGLARFVAGRTRECDWIFLGHSGHELGFAGMRAYLRDEPPPRERVKCWMLFGAAVAAFEWQQGPEGLLRLDRVDARRRLYASEDLLSIARKTFAGIPCIGPLADQAGGAQRLLVENSYSRMGLSLGNFFHHLKSDGPQMTAPALLEPLARASAIALAMAESR
jgi:hypothetical protein